MKKIIIILTVLSILSLGFTLVGSKISPKEEDVRVDQNNSTNYSGISDQNDKRLASWD